MNFPLKLQTLRKEKGMSQENLAELLGVSRQSVSKWEAGQSYPEIEKLIIISELFKVSIDNLVKENNFKSENVSNNNNIVNLGYRNHYEYKSKRKLFNIPIVHINIGNGIYVAKGIIAIGTISIGFLSIGAIALGVVSIGAIALGIGCAIGGISIGTLALGGASIGIVALGGLAVGMFSFGGCAIASHIAVGGYARGHIAIGDTVKGIKTIAGENHNFSNIKAEQVKQLINQEYPYLWRPIRDLISSIFN